ncbi:hypothetical protein ABZ896_26405 [Streptomyces sp. NPDC047072]|uniref:hypothetical protein n=1 Tax=Streptomyces sp. NPDC047072 TaxID=3154809 RepID=UPI0033F7CE6A
MTLTGSSCHPTMIGVINTADLAGSAPASAAPGTGGAVFFIVVGVGLLCGGAVIATDYKKAASRFYARAMSTQQKKPPRIYGGPTAGVLLLKTIGLLQILAGSGAVAVGIYFLSR